jgi:hypothetical protein
MLNSQIDVLGPSSLTALVISQITAFKEFALSPSVDQKRDPLREMIEGTVPTKVNKSKDGSVEAVFDMLGALIADAKMAGEFDCPKLQSKHDGISVTFEIYHRNHPNPPREWMESKLEVSEGVVESCG